MPGDKTGPASGLLKTCLSTMTLAVIVVKSSLVIFPGRKMFIVSPLTIMTVDSKPTCVSPPSIIHETLF